MTTKLNLYDHRIEPIGTATWDKAKSVYKVEYSDDVYIGDRFVPYEEFEAYKDGLKLNSLRGEQTSLMDFI